MDRIFISYRRIESEDISGRLFDRLAGYFDPESVFMDVDVLISGADYREQISKFIDQCGILLAIIGEQWTTITDDSGKRRLDDPEDQLRIEIAAALEKGLAVIPILVHKATLPLPDELPADLKRLAKQEPLELQSGLPFNTDVQKLLDRLETDHGLRHPDRRFPLEFVLIPLGIALTVWGLLSLTQIPGLQQFAYGLHRPEQQAPGADYSLEAYRADLMAMVLHCTIPLGLGPLLIVVGQRFCCLAKEARRERRHFSSGIGGKRLPKSGRSVACLGLGLASISLGVVAAIPTFLVAIWAFADVKLRRGWKRGGSLIVAGLLVAVVGGGFSAKLHWDRWRFDQWMQLWTQAEAAAEAGNTESALEFFQRSIDEAPVELYGVGAAHLRKAELYVAENELEAAVDELTRLIDICEPEVEVSQFFLAGNVGGLVADAYRNRAKLYDALGMPDEAQQDRDQVEQGMQIPMAREIELFPNPVAPPPEPGPRPPEAAPEAAPAPPAPMPDPDA